MRTVHKFPIDAHFMDSDATFRLPAGNVVMVAAQKPLDPLPTIWIDRDTDEVFEQRLLLAATGESVPADAEHIGSAVCDGGRLVWHIFGIPS